MLDEDGVDEEEVKEVRREGMVRMLDRGVLDRDEVVERVGDEVEERRERRRRMVRLPFPLRSPLNRSENRSEIEGMGGVFV